MTLIATSSFLKGAASIDGFRRLARRRTPGVAYHYLDSDSGREAALKHLRWAHGT